MGHKAATCSARPFCWPCAVRGRRSTCHAAGGKGCPEYPPCEDSSGSSTETPSSLDPKDTGDGRREKTRMKIRRKGNKSEGRLSLEKGEKDGMRNREALSSPGKVGGGPDDPKNNKEEDNDKKKMEESTEKKEEPRTTEEKGDCNTLETGIEERIITGYKEEEAEKAEKKEEERNSDAREQKAHSSPSGTGGGPEVLDACLEEEDNTEVETSWEEQRWEFTQKEGIEETSTGGQENRPPPEGAQKPKIHTVEWTEEELKNLILGGNNKKKNKKEKGQIQTKKEETPKKVKKDVKRERKALPSPLVRGGGPRVPAKKKERKNVPWSWKEGCSICGYLGDEIIGIIPEEFWLSDRQRDSLWNSIEVEYMLEMFIPLAENTRKGGLYQRIMEEMVEHLGCLLLERKEKPPRLEGSCLSEDPEDIFHREDNRGLSKTDTYSREEREYMDLVHQLVIQYHKERYQGRKRRKKIKFQFPPEKLS